MTKNKNSFTKEFESLMVPLTKFIIKRVSGDSEAKEEVLSETMVAAWRGWNTFKHKSSYFTWLCRIALNKIADYYRDQINVRSRFIFPGLKSLADIESKDIAPEEKLALNELRLSVNSCLNLLSPRKRQLLQFRYWQDLSYAEIAKLLGLSERAVEGQLYRARNEFARAWEEHYS